MLRHGIRLRSWAKWQAAMLAKVRSTRKARVARGESPPESMTAPLSMQSVMIAAVFDDEHFGAFAERVGGACAETYFLRVCQFVANGHGLTGECPIKRERFAAIVLSRAWHIVPRKTGELVYDALLSSGIAQPITDTTGSASCGETCGATGGPTGGASCGTLARAYPALPCPSLPVPTPPCPAVPVPDAPASGGASASLPPQGERNDRGPPGSALSADDLGVFEALWRRRERMRADDASACERLTEGLRAKTPDADAIRAFVDRMTPSFVEDVTKVRRAFRMAANGRHGRAAS